MNLIETSNVDIIKYFGNIGLDVNKLFSLNLDPENRKEKEDSKDTSIQTSTEGTFLWTKNEQGLVLGSYFWGYFVTQVTAKALKICFGNFKILN